MVKPQGFLQIFLNNSMIYSWYWYQHDFDVIRHVATLDLNGIPVDLITWTSWRCFTQNACWDVLNHLDSCCTTVCVAKILPTYRVLLDFCTLPFMQDMAWNAANLSGEVRRGLLQEVFHSHSGSETHHPFPLMLFSAVLPWDSDFVFCSDMSVLVYLIASDCISIEVLMTP